MNAGWWGPMTLSEAHRLLREIRSAAMEAPLRSGRPALRTVIPINALAHAVNARAASPLPPMRASSASR